MFFRFVFSPYIPILPVYLTYDVPSIVTNRFVRDGCFEPVLQNQIKPMTASVSAGISKPLRGKPPD